MFYFPQTLAFKKVFCKLANQTPHCLCAGWAAAAEMLFPSSKILGKSVGKLACVAEWAATDVHKGAGMGQVTDEKKSFTWTLFSLNELVSAHWPNQVLLQKLPRMWDIWKLQPHWMLIQPPLLTDHCAVLLYRWCLHDVEWPLGTTLTFQSLA